MKTFPVTLSLSLAGCVFAFTAVAQPPPAGIPPRERPTYFPAFDGSNGGGSPAPIREGIQEKRFRGVSMYVEQMTRRLTAAITRLTTLASRIEQGIVERESQGKPLRNARALLDDARAELRKATDILQGARTSLDAISTAERPREVFVQARERIGEVIKHLKAAHRSLVRIIPLIRGLPTLAPASAHPSPPLSSPLPTP